MRLTLRTLLAYLDDILEPTQAREIGVKVSESDFATTLLERIRDVIRRRRLTAPELEGPGSGLDPNTVAEYLDNTLSPSNVAEVEKICLESDVHLAEAAASHQILTLILGEPVEVSPSSLNRMYALGPVSEDERVSLTTETPVVGPAVVAPGVREASVPVDVEAESTWRQAVPFLIVTVVGLFWLWLIFGDNSLRPAESEHTASLAPVEHVRPEPSLPAENAGSLPDNGPDAAAASASIAAVSPIAAEPQSIEQTQAASESDSSTKPVIPPAPNAAGSADRSAVASTSAVIADAGSDQTDPAGSPDAILPPRPGEEVKPAPRLTRSVQGDVMLQYSRNDANWFIMSDDESIGASDRIAVPEPFEASLKLEELGMEFTLLGPGMLEYQGPNQLASFGFFIDRGRLIIDSRRQPLDDEQEPEPVKLSIAWHDHIRLFELSGAESRCGIEITQLLPAGFEQLPADGATSARVIVEAGTVRLSDSNDHSLDVSAPDAADLTLLTLIEPEPEPASLPEWLRSEPLRVTPTTRRYASNLVAEFDPSVSAANSMTPLLRDRRPRMVELAVRCLALIRKYSLLVRTLASSDVSEARAAAAHGISGWLARDPQNAALLRHELGQHLAPDDVEVVYRLLWGLGDREARNRHLSRELIEFMDHRLLFVRELAFGQARRLTGLRYGYRPEMSATMRQSALRRWQNHIERVGALVDPPANEQ